MASDKRDTVSKGHSLKRLIAVGAACSAVSSIATVVIKGKDSAEARVRLIAQAVADPIRHDLNDHIHRADQAMGPGGVMYKRFSKMEARVDWLVKERICRTVPRQPCPPFSEVLEER